MKLARASIATLALLLLLPGAASADCPPPVATATGLRALDAENQVVLTGTLDVPKGYAVENAVVIDGDANVAGQVTEDLIVVNGRATISGTVDGDVVTLSDRAVLTRRGCVAGDLIYGDEKPVVPASATVEGEVRSFETSDIGDELASALIVLGILLLVGAALSTLLLGLLLLWLAPRVAEAVLEPAGSSVGPSIGWGVALALGVPILGVLLAVTVIGIPLGFILLLLLIPLYVVGYVTSQWLVGRMILGPPHRPWVSLLVGWAVLTVASLIPFIGSLTGVAAVVYGLGVLAVATWRSQRDKDATPPGATSAGPSPDSADVPVPPPPPG
ncbi:MAG: hypothetical protein WDZ37_06085 [Solirubrobacterales bacterium]